MKLKKLLCAMLSAAMVVSLTACGSGDSTSKTEEPKKGDNRRKRQMLQVKQQIQRKKMDLQPH